VVASFDYHLFLYVFRSTAVFLGDFTLVLPLNPASLHRADRHSSPNPFLLVFRVRDREVLFYSLWQEELLPT